MDKDYLSEQEEVLIQSFVKNDKMFAAVKKVMLATIYHQGVVDAGKTPTDMNFAFSIINDSQAKTNEQVGEELRACVKGLGFLKSGFDRLKEFTSKPETPKPKSNPAL